MNCSVMKSVPNGVKKYSIFSLLGGKDPDNVLGVCAALAPTYKERAKNPEIAKLPDSKPNGHPPLSLTKRKTNDSQLRGPKPGLQPMTQPNSIRIAKTKVECFGKAMEIPVVESGGEATPLHKMYKKLVDFEKEYRSCYEGLKSLVQKLKPELDIDAMMERAEMDTDSFSTDMRHDIVSSDTTLDSGVYLAVEPCNGSESDPGGLEKVDKATKPNIYDQETILKLSEVLEEDEAENRRIISGIRMCFGDSEAESELQMMGLLEGSTTDTMLELSDEELFKEDEEQERRMQKMQQELLLLEENVEKLEQRNETSMEVLKCEIRKMYPNREDEEGLLQLILNPDDLKDEMDFLELGSAGIAKPTEETPLESPVRQVPEPLDHGHILLKDSLTLAHRPSGGQGILENTPVLPQQGLGSSKPPRVEPQRQKVPKSECPVGRIPVSRVSAKKALDLRPKWNQHEVKVIVRERQPKVYRCPALPAAARPQEWKPSRAQIVTKIPAREIPARLPRATKPRNGFGPEPESIPRKSAGNKDKRKTVVDIVVDQRNVNVSSISINIKTTRTF